VNEGRGENSMLARKFQVSSFKRSSPISFPISFPNKINDDPKFQVKRFPINKFPQYKKKI